MSFHLHEMKIKKIESVSSETEVMRIIHFQYKKETGGCTFDNVKRQAKFNSQKLSTVYNHEYNKRVLVAYILFHYRQYSH